MLNAMLIIKGRLGPSRRVNATYDIVNKELSCLLTVTLSYNALCPKRHTQQNTNI